MKLKRRYHKILWGIENWLRDRSFDRAEHRKARSLTHPGDAFSQAIRRAFGALPAQS